jgi:hypothetical protein
MRCREHRLRGDFGERFRQDLFGGRFGLEAEAFAAGAAHAERVSAGGAIELALTFENDRHHLIGGGRIRRAARGDEDRIGIGAVGDDGRRA